ncbi:MAG TPA: beta-galactosidase [Lacipirellulaceae bacterium]|nr:beta-galactosidase [Lacipirellulaceae bacterium]
MPRSRYLRILFAALCWLVLAHASPACAATPTHTFAIGDEAFLLDGQPYIIRCGEVHAARVPKEYWRHRLQMAKAMGLNTVCAYLFWNQHEPRQGQFTWDDRADIAEYCRIAQELGLWVILRPGPYACAEWEMGGLPWWLLKHDDIALRSRDPRFMEATRRYLKEVGRELAPLQITRGGPIIMVQAENEYGFYGTDAEYMGEIRQALLDAGFEVPLFACNPKDALRKGYREDLFPVVNFGSDPEGAFRELRKILPKGPLMCGEFYPGWFDTWGAPHHTGNADRYLSDLEYMLKNKASFSIYMAHGGTTFGFGTGADRPFKPDTSSYDYDAPISEAGWPTDKFWKTRELFAKYLNEGETIPEPPAQNPVITIAPQAAQASSVEFEGPAEARSAPLSFEQYDQPYGCILYVTEIPAGPAATLSVGGVHDIGQVVLDKKRVGFLDRRNRRHHIEIPARESDATLGILVEAMGRVNFGREVHDRKGLRGPVKLGDVALESWGIYRLPLDDESIRQLTFSSGSGSHIEGAGFYRATVTVAAPGDTFLDMRPWGKGYVWVNGHNLGRFWNIGPQQTMYVPGPWLKKGENEIIILDLLGPSVNKDFAATIAGLAEPILNELRPELDFIQPEPHKTIDLKGLPLIHEAAFAPGTSTQTVMFAKPARGRTFALESRSAHDNQPFAAIAELTLLDPQGEPLDASATRIAAVDSEEKDSEDGSAGNAIDGQTANFWHTQWGAAQPPHPHQFVLDLGSEQTIGGFRYVPRQGGAGLGGRIKSYRIHIGTPALPPVP